MRMGFDNTKHAGRDEDFPGKNIASAARGQSLSCARGGEGRVGEGQERSRWKLMAARSGASGYGDRRSVPLKRTRGRQRRSTKSREMEEEVACAESPGKWGPKGQKLVSMGFCVVRGCRCRRPMASGNNSG
ncbi:hypothetical protein TRVL_07020 [Trypanosoma vivax]|nr:hypothetical protein TRVL_07020 [Trypanosoma vivax]